MKQVTMTNNIAIITSIVCVVSLTICCPAKTMSTILSATKNDLESGQATHDVDISIVLKERAPANKSLHQIKHKIMHTEKDTNQTARQHSGTPPSLNKKVTVVKQRRAYGILTSRCSHVTQYYNKRWVQAISYCPLYWRNETVRHMCENWETVRENSIIDHLSLLPVQDSEGNVYGNIFCAKCHQLEPDVIYPWRSKAVCEDNQVDKLRKVLLSADAELNIDIIGKLMITNRCQVHILPAFPNLVRSCPGDFTNHAFLYFRSRRLIRTTIAKSPPVSFSLLLNFDLKGRTHILLSAEEIVEEPQPLMEPVKRCKESETYDSINDRCRPIKCSPNHKLQGSECVSTSNSDTQKSRNVKPDTRDESIAMTLSINTTYGMYVLVRDTKNFKDLVVKQLAESLKISEDRFTQVNITFDYKEVSGPSVRIRKITGQQNQRDVTATEKVNSKSTESVTNYDDVFGKSYNDTDTQNDRSKNATNIIRAELNTTYKNVDNINTKSTRRSKELASEKGNSNEMPTFNIYLSNSEQQQRSESNESGSVNSSSTDEDRPMTMHISFVIQPSKINDIRDKVTRVVARRIKAMVTLNQLNFFVSGKQLSVSKIDNAESMISHPQSFCKHGEVITLDKDKFSFLQINGSGYIYSQDDGVYYKQGEFNLFAYALGIDENSQTHLTYFDWFSTVCVMPKISNPDCVRIDLMPDEYSYVNDNRSIMFHGQILGMDNYTIMNESTGLVEICLPPLYKKENLTITPRPVIHIAKGCASKFKAITKAGEYITMIIGRISSVALALVFITYCLFPSLRTIPGCNIMNLTLALFIAELLFIEGIRVPNQYLCAAIAATLHFFFLVAHFWMNVISFDVYRTFSKKAVLTKKDAIRKKTDLPKYSMYGWGMPLFIVGICLFIEYSNVFDIQIGYKVKPLKYEVLRLADNESQTYQNSVDIDGDSHDNSSFKNGNKSRGRDINLSHESICWIHQPVASLVTFGAPVMIIFFANCLFFTRTIISVSRTVKQTRQTVNRQESNSSAGKTSNRSEVMVYLRMASVMGFTWVFGLASVLISSLSQLTDALCIAIHTNSFLFILFNVSQGIFIFVAFICNRRVFHLYARMLFKFRQAARRRHHSDVYTFKFKSDSIFGISNPAHQ